MFNVQRSTFICITVECCSGYLFVRARQPLSIIFSKRVYRYKNNSHWQPALYLQKKNYLFSSQRTYLYVIDSESWDSWSLVSIRVEATPCNTVVSDTN
jgi:hypothetical protein